MSLSPASWSLMDVLKPKALISRLLEICTIHEGAQLMHACLRMFLFALLQLLRGVVRCSLYRPGACVVIMSNLQEIIANSVCDNVREVLRVENGDIPLIKRNKSLQNGDFQIPLNGLRKLVGKVDDNVNETQLENILKEGSYGKHVCKSVVTNDKLFLHLHRKEVFWEEICRVLGNEQPWSQECTQKMILVNAAFVCHTEKSLSHLRTVLLSHHISSLLKINGHNVRCSIPTDTPLHQLLGNDSTNKHDKDFSGCELYDSLKRTSFCESQEADALVVDYKALLDNLHFCQGKDSYDRNIDKSIVKREDDKLQGLASLKKDYESCPKEPNLCIHVTPANYSFSMQQVDLLWHMLGNNTKQMHVAHGPVVPKRAAASSGLSCEEFLRIREEETKRAFQMKYGDHVSGDKWTEIVRELSYAAVKFDLLSTSFRNSVKVDISEAEGGEAENRPGVFVMYNYARLATLMQRFDTAVSNGTYPPMPDVTDVNFSLLKEEGEWELMFNYILPYSNLLKECVAELSKDTVKPNIHTHKICQFLLDLSRDLSSYYSRVHVLGENLPHLLPLMYARLSLLQTIKKVMEHGLQLLNVTPISQL